MNKTSAVATASANTIAKANKDVLNLRDIVSGQHGRTAGIVNDGQTMTGSGGRIALNTKELLAHIS